MLTRGYSVHVSQDSRFKMASPQEQERVVYSLSNLNLQKRYSVNFGLPINVHLQDPQFVDMKHRLGKSLLRLAPFPFLIASFAFPSRRICVSCLDLREEEHILRHPSRAIIKGKRHVNCAGRVANPHYSINAPWIKAAFLFIKGSPLLPQQQKNRECVRKDLPLSSLDRG
ncbi:hypothetical protein TNCV_2793671 [Trichonephila clavipes]|nr:hypothetical protein TNCV_2793671 [Trichonephila clavipes]